MANQFVENLSNLLTIVNEKGLGAEDLKTNFTKLYDRLFEALADYVNFYVTASRSNRSKIMSLAEAGEAAEDLKADLLSHLFLKLDYILAQQSAEKQLNYIYKMVNFRLVDFQREVFSARARHTVSLQDSCFDDAGDHVPSLEEHFADNSFNPEEILLKKEAEGSCFEQYCLRHHMNPEEKRRALLETIRLLKDNPSQLLALMAVDEAKTKPAELADKLMKSKNLALVFADVLYKIGKLYGILPEIREIFQTAPILEGASFKLNSGDKTVVSAQISRLKNRAKHTVAAVK